jgi:hypothetical protein
MSSAGYCEFGNISPSPKGLVRRNTNVAVATLTEKRGFFLSKFGAGRSVCAAMPDGFGRGGLVRKAGRVATFTFLTPCPPDARRNVKGGFLSHVGAKSMTNKTTRKAAKTANTSKTLTHIEVKKIALDLGLKTHDLTGEVVTQSVAETEPMPFMWGSVAGCDLMLKQLQVLELNAHLGLHPAEGLQDLLESAFQVLRDPAPRLNGDDQSGAARQVISLVCQLAVLAIETNQAKKIIESEQKALLEMIDEDDRTFRREMKERAITHRAAKKSAKSMGVTA